MDSAIGVHMIDRWTYYALEFLEKVTPSSQATLADFVSPACSMMYLTCDSHVTLQFASFDPAKVRSTPQVRKDLFRRPLDKVLLTDFFGSVRSIELLNQTSGSSEWEGQVGGDCAEVVRPSTGGHYLAPQDSLVRGEVTGRCRVSFQRLFCYENAGPA